MSLCIHGISFFRDKDSVFPEKASGIGEKRLKFGVSPAGNGVPSLLVVGGGLWCGYVYEVDISLRRNQLPFVRLTRILVNIFIYIFEPICMKYLIFFFGNSK